MDETRKAVLEELARLLAQAWPDPENRVCLERDMFPHTREEAYFVQDGMHRLLGGGSFRLESWCHKSKNA